MVDHSVVVCPSCKAAYHVSLSEKGIGPTEAFQFSCAHCGCAWLPSKASDSVSDTPQQPSPPTFTSSTPNTDSSARHSREQAQSGHHSYQSPLYANAPVAPQLQSSDLIQESSSWQWGTVVALVAGTALLIAVGGFVFAKYSQSTETAVAPMIDFNSNVVPNIRDVRYDLQTIGTRQTILVVGVIDNTTQQSIPLKPLKISVYGPCAQVGILNNKPDASGACLVSEWQQTFDTNQLDAGQSKPFQTVGSISADMGVSRVDVSLP